MHVCRYFHEDHLPDPIRSELEESLYGVLLDPGSNDSSSDRNEADDQKEAPDALGGTIRRLARTVTFGEYTRGNTRLAERIAHEAVHWVGDRWRELEENDPFAREETSLEESARLATEGTDPVELAQEAARHRPELSRLAAATATRAERSPNAAAEPVLRAAYAQEILDRWRSRMETDRSTYRARELGRTLGKFVRELGRIVPRLADQQQVVRDALGNERALWDLSMHEWEELPTGGLEQAAATLAELPELRDLASMLGRSKTVSEQRTVLREEARVRLRPVGIGKSEVTGICNGDDLSSLIPSELALLAQPETEELFYAKLAQRQLFVLDYNREQLVEYEERRIVPTSEVVIVKRGPVIVCVDTSGSMLGLPERIAKAAVLALAGELEQHGRDLEVIAFASQTRSFSLPYSQGTADLPALAGFLAGGFHGGTDLHKALEVAITSLDRRELGHADVLVVSDFRVPKIADRYAEQFKRAHRTGTLFHALTVAQHPVIDPLHIFDSAWHCSTETGRIDPGMLRRTT